MTDLTLTVEEYPGGPPVDLISVQIEITDIGGATTYLAATSTGIGHPSTGLYTYSWAVPTAGDYLVIWTGIDGDGDAFTASEVLSASGPSPADSDTALAIGQFQLGTVLFGRRTGIEVTDFSISEPASTTADLVIPGEDGIVMGRDYLQGRVLSWNLVVDQYTATAGKERWGALEAAWDAREVRLTPGAVTALRMRDHGSGTRVVYGRPRKFTPADLSFTRNGAIPVVADFTTADRFFYDDTETVLSFGVRPTIGTGGGITWPVTWPIIWASADLSNSDVAVNAGNAPTWPVITFNGPITNPTVVLGDNLHTLQLVTTLADNETVTIDTRPWARTITRSDGASLAGLARGSRLADLMLPSGRTAIGIQGIDLDGTAGATLRYRSAYTNP